ncbi:hypothetical protein AOCH_004676 [Aspergillus ochraceoroseus]|uniref:Glycosyl hydrolase family 13 catalytic domain-containing protein n=1 Tax=Aspergillus ochraceoroseus TaxID=138278 RepID=A0A0F8V8K9_9EURO|nr:hypothetical protein AOCH_004676 [Aspergillus ochraceoroseus]
MPADRRYWRRLEHALPGLKAIGFDRLWIPPGCKGMDPLGNGYDIYDLYDLGEFDQKGATATKWGTKQELEALMREAQHLGVAVYWDAVLNHKAGADHVERFTAVPVDPKQRTAEISKPIQVDGWVGFDFHGRNNAYSAMKYHWHHFSGIDWDDMRKKGGIYKILGPNKDWASDVSTENGNYDYLMFADLDLSHPEVRQDLLHWGTWITTALSLGGMRLDAAKHFSSGFQRAFVEHVRATANPDFFVMAEYWTGDIRALLGYLEQMDETVAAYDVPLLGNFSRASYRKGAAADLRGILQNTLVQQKPNHAVTPVEPSFKLLAYALILLRKEGHPCVFYGDLYGTRPNSQHHHHRTTPPACNGKLPILIQARKLYAYGEQQDYFDHPNCIGFVRYGNSSHACGLVCLLSNAGPAQKQMYVGSRHANTEWVDLLQATTITITIDRHGYGVFPIGAMTAGVWVPLAGQGQESFQAL